MNVTHDELLKSAIGGNRSALGALLVDYRAYLKMLARSQIHRKMQGKADASDVVQDVFLEVQKNFVRFRGNSNVEFRGWLRKILASSLATYFRRYLGTKQRDLRLEQSLAVELDHTSCCLQKSIAVPGPSPSQVLMKRETLLELAAAIDSLPFDYRTVLLLRHIESMSFPAIAESMNKSLDSVEKLWVRGLGKLRSAMERSNSTDS